MGPRKRGAAPAAAEPEKDDARKKKPRESPRRSQAPKEADDVEDDDDVNQGLGPKDAGFKLGENNRGFIEDVEKYELVARELGTSTDVFNVVGGVPLELITELTKKLWNEMEPGGAKPAWATLRSKLAQLDFCRVRLSVHSYLNRQAEFEQGRGGATDAEEEDAVEEDAVGAEAVLVFQRWHTVSTLG